MDFTLVGLWHEMGIVARAVVVVLAIMSLYSLGITGERLVTFRRGRRLSRLYIEALAPLVEEAGRLGEAVGLDKRYAGSPVASVIGTGLAEYARGQGRPGAAPPAFEVAEVVNRAMERSKERQLAGLRRGMPVLATVASSAPFVGLFGTVVGILKAFQSMSVAGTGGFKVVSQGIAAALVATAAGLLVAIYAVIAYNYFVARVNAIAMQYKLYAEEFLAALGEQARGRAGAVPAAAPAPAAPAATPTPTPSA
jgi:biopolymer transport protein ExbB